GFRQEGLAGEIVLVDCGSGPEEANRLEAAGADVFLALDDNRGYSGGVNAGLARATSSRLLLCNADVVFRPGALRPLLEAADEPGVGAAAPLAYWDAADRIRLPPGFPSGFFSDLAQLSAGRSPERDATRFAAFARETLALWDRGGAARHLTGAVLAVHRRNFDRVGRFDERFPFEYEETEWEDRVRAAGLTLRFVPQSRVRHLWGSSAAASADAAARRAASRRVYWRRRYGSLGRVVLARAARRTPPSRFPRIAEPRLPARDGAWVAVSTNPSLLPFAGAPLDRAFELPPEIAARLPRGPLYLRSFRAADGYPIDTSVWEKA
ncbi:MAG: glycosyltransferase, partial [Acidobacteriota bacterium]